MKALKKIVAIAILAAMSVSMFAGCGGNEDVVVDDGSAKLTYWAPNNASKYVSNYDEVYSFQKIQENLGIDIEFIHPSASTGNEQFNIMIASGEYTDLIYAPNWGSLYNGGLSQALKDNVIVDLTPYYEDGKLPNFKKAVQKHPGLETDYKTVEGQILFVDAIRSDEAMNASLGLIIRKDWLDKLGLSVPENITDWYNMLVAFKDKDPNGNGQKDEIPYGDHKSQFFGNFAAAFGTKRAYYKKDGKIVYGSVQPEYKEYLVEMNKWYNEGLMESEFAAIAKTNLDANVLNDKVGSFVGYVGSYMGNYLNARKGDGSTFDLVAAPWPKTKDGRKFAPTDITGNAGTGGLVLTTACKKPDLAIKFMDYMYSDEATELLNWGEEGKTYTNENGERKLTDFVLKNPDGAEPLAASSDYFFGSLGVPPKYWLYESYAQLQFNYPQQQNATETWAQEADNMLVGTKYKFTAEENKRLAQLKADLNTYEAEMFTKMVIGKEPISKFDEYVEKIYGLGLDEVLEIYEVAHKRYEDMMKNEK